VRTRSEAPSHLQIDDPHWYRDAIIYELHVRAFRDGDGDGTGDFAGLTEKLDYIRDLGVTAIWLLPFYSSPLRDDGYDIADFRSIHPAYGTLRDFRTFLSAAHARGIRVITELVLNHTSDQHAWFQRARTAPAGHPWRDYYVWSDTASEYAGARIIFKDFERSNWTWDPVAGQHFWHRFYSHQPDLNFDNPRVRREVFEIVDYWLRMGVDGFRLDAVPYLFEREGTSCENLPETHAFLKELRAHIDEHFPGRVLLAEANQWPQDAAKYFGDGDECHMAYHFPLMPRLFLAARTEDRFPITEILEQTPPIPENAHWALFLRNHDELTLEMVTDEERDHMYRAYAGEERARINLGIRRRLGPLLGNNRRLIELMHALLLSLEGTPVIYYGDEIGMGDNIYLGDRDSVRTPMQWSGERNAGFSAANPQRLFLPVVTDPEYHYESINVEAQQANPSLLLWWMRRVIALRKRHRAFSRGNTTIVESDNRRIFAFLREFEGEKVLVVANLSRFTQGVHLGLAGCADSVPVELFGRARFPTIGESPYFLSLGPHTFFWFHLEPVARAEAGHHPSVLSLNDGEHWTSLLNGRRGDLAGVLANYLPARRWYGSKTRTIQQLSIDDVLPLGRRTDVSASLVIVRLEFVHGEPERFALVLAAINDERRPVIDAAAPWATVAQLERPGGTPLWLVDGLAVPEVAGAFLGLFKSKVTLNGPAGSLEFVGSTALRGPSGELLPVPLWAEQSNTSVSFGDRFMMKFLRRIETGVHPQVELGEFLSTSTVKQMVPRPLGNATYRARGGTTATVALIESYIPHQSDAWKLALDELDRFLEGIASSRMAPAVVAAGTNVLFARPTDPYLAEHCRGWLELSETMGRRTAQLHAALSSDPRSPAFEPERYNPFYQQALAQGFRVRARQSFRSLRAGLPHLSKETSELATEVLGLESAVLEVLQAVVDEPLRGARIRCHGDLHLAQILVSGGDCMFIDFEGEPARSLGDRRSKRSPLRDVAGMMRSFFYASQVALRQVAIEVGDEGDDPLRQWAQRWYMTSGSAFFEAYLREIEDCHLLAADERETRLLLNAFMLDKSLYEVGYELDNRPDWVDIPLRGILQLLHGLGEGMA
jgi:maltose alpha-D-glucosyltransferase/alpha-amylase